MASGLYRVEYMKSRESAKLSTNVAADTQREAEEHVRQIPADEIAIGVSTGYIVLRAEYLARIDEVAA